MTKIKTDEMIKKIRDIIDNTEGLKYGEVIGILEMIKFDLLNETIEGE